MNQMKLMEKILTNDVYCEKIIHMTLEDFQAALAEHDVSVQNAEALFRKLKDAIAGGELSDEDLAGVAGGALACNYDDLPDGC